MKNSFLRQISDLSEFMDFRPPFEDEMKKWVRYILKSRHIQITESAIGEYIELYGDSIAHVINEAEKMGYTTMFLSKYTQNIEKDKGKIKLIRVGKVQEVLKHLFQ